MAFLSLSGYLGVNELNKEGISLSKRYAYVTFFQAILFMFTTTFLIIYVVNRVGIAQVGILSAILLFAQSFLDYPLGVVSDSIGQRWVIAAGSFVFAIADILLLLGNTFLDFVPVYILYGLMIALFSGAYETWFDNNYNALVTKEEDSDRKIYGFLKSRISTLFSMGAVVAFIIGGAIATFYSPIILVTLSNS